MRSELTSLENTFIVAGQTFWGLSSQQSGTSLKITTGDRQKVSKIGRFVSLDVGQSLLLGQEEERLAVSAANLNSRDCLQYFESSDFIAGIAQLPIVSGNMEEQSHRVYRAILETIDSRYLYRIWNFVPDINHEDPGRMENYKLFCCGRTLAFAEQFGDGDSGHFPSASATGCRNGKLTVAFLAGKARVTHWENPEQVPAYEYPIEYGPRSPAFARASRFKDPGGADWILVAGTAAIKGCETVYPGEFDRQLPVMFDNLELILSEGGMTLNGQSGWRRHFKVFLRRRENLPRLMATMGELIGPNDTFSVVEADICRSDLEVEIELLACAAG